MFDLAPYVAAIRNYFDLLFQSDWAVTITVRTFQGMRDDPELKRQVPAYEDHSFRALNTEKGWNWGQEGRVLFNRARANFIIQNENLPEIRGVQDLLVDENGVSRKVTAYVDHFGVVTSISLEGTE